MFTAGELNGAQAAFLNLLVQEFQKYGMRLDPVAWPLTVTPGGGVRGQKVGIDPKAFDTVEPDEVPDYIVNVCPEVTAGGCPTGRLWITWADDEGNTTCELTECTTCVGEAAPGCAGA